MNKKNVISLVLLFTFFIVIAHNIIPHHHHYYNIKNTECSYDSISNNKTTFSHTCNHNDKYGNIANKSNKCSNVCHFFVNILRIDILSTVYINTPDLNIIYTITRVDNIFENICYIIAAAEYFSSASNKAPPAEF